MLIDNRAADVILIDTDCEEYPFCFDLSTLKLSAITQKAIDKVIKANILMENESELLMQFIIEKGDKALFTVSMISRISQILYDIYHKHLYLLMETPTQASNRELQLNC